MVALLQVGVIVAGAFGSLEAPAIRPDGTIEKRRKRQLIEGVITESVDQQTCRVLFNNGTQRLCSLNQLKFIRDPRYSATSSSSIQHSSNFGKRLSSQLLDEMLTCHRRTNQLCMCFVVACIILLFSSNFRLPSISQRYAEKSKKLSQFGWISVSLNPDSTMVNDLIGIYHDPSLSSIHVVIEANASSMKTVVEGDRQPCLRPYLMGRLSGPAIGIVGSPWLYHLHPTTMRGRATTIIEGRYNVPTTGVYFLEIIVLLCNTWNDDELRRRDDIEIITQQCLENPVQHRLTAQGVTIEVRNPRPFWSSNVSSSTIPSHMKFSADIVDESAPMENSFTSTLHSGVSHGYWLRRNIVNETSESHLKPLYTRYQMSFDCKNDFRFNPNMRQCCIDASDLSRFEPYQFVWSSKLLDSNTSTGDKTTLEMRVRKYQGNDTICLFGASHAGVLKAYLQTFIKQQIFHSKISFAKQLGSFNGTIAEIAEQVRSHVKQTSIPQSEEVASCTIVILGVGAWDAGFPESLPTTVFSYERSIRNTLENVQAAYPNSRVFLWNERSMALGHIVWHACPARDWRHPAFIDEYNAALRRVVSGSSLSKSSSPPVSPVQYLDTSFIVTPLWDSPVDWSHFNNNVGQTEALYVAAIIFEILPLYTWI